MINIAELLKEAPKDMKLYSPLFGEVEFCDVDTADSTIVVRTGHGNKEWFSMTGKYKINKSHFLYSDSECLLFPSKECRTWENFELPVKPKFKVGDWITDGTCKVKITDINNTHYWYSKNCILGEIESINKKYHLWTIQDAKDGDVLVTEDYIFIFKHILHGGVHLYCHYNIDDEEFDSDIPDAIIGNIHDKGAHFQPATKEQCSLFFAKMKEAGYEWDAENEELHKIIKPKFKVENWIIRNDGCSDVPIRIYGLKKDMYLVDNILGSKGEVMLTCQDEWHLWTIQDAKDGDILIDEATHTIGIFEEISKTYWRSKIYCGNSTWGSVFSNGGLHKIEGTKPATKEQRDFLFQKIKEAGYQWNPVKKELRNIINPKFKVGDEIKTGNTIETIAEVGYATRSYYCESGRTIYFANQDLWHLVPKPHYDIANFYAGMPVLVREYDTCHWQWVQYSHFNGVGLFFAAGKTWRQCIPFEGNEHLLGTTDMPSEEYINW